MSEATEQDAQFIAEYIDGWESHYGLELSDELLDEMIAAATENRAPNGEPQIAPILEQTLANYEAEGGSVEEAPNDWAEEFQAQQEQLEKRLDRGRHPDEDGSSPTLTSKEIQALADDAGSSDQPLNLVEAYDRLFPTDSANKDDRRLDTATAIFDEIQAADQDNEAAEQGDFEEAEA